MSSDEAVVRELLAAWNERRSAADAYWPDVVFDMTAEPIPEYPPVIHGHAAYAQFLRDYLMRWREYSVEPLEVVDRGDSHVAAVVREKATSVDGVPFERVISALYTLRDGKVAAITFFYGRGALAG